MSKHKYKIITLLLIAVVFATTGFSCKFIPQKEVPKTLTKKTNLTYWGVWDDSSYIKPIIDSFQSLHPNVKITYKKFRYVEYEQKLLEAWADDRGPDIYSLPAAWLKKYQSRITPQPDKVQLAFQEVKKTLGKTEISTVVRSVPIFRTSDIKNKFVDVVYDDIIINNKIYALPYSVDTMVMYYNRNLLDLAGVPIPPKTWIELTETVKKVTKINQDNQIVQAGVALGTTDNISNAVDIVSLLMMQNGTQMTDSNGNPTFHLPSAGDKTFIPGLEALRFYTDFADPIKEVYSWGVDQKKDIDAFISGKLAIMFGYSYQLPVIKGRAPKLDIGIAPMLQIQSAVRPINITNYWVETVSHKSKDSDIAWGFLNYAASEKQVKMYLDKSKKPTALRSLIAQQIEDPTLNTFVNQSLSARRWYRGSDSNKMEELFSDLINQFPESLEPAKLLQYIASRIK